jgi:hypothetical protein
MKRKKRKKRNGEMERDLEEEGDCNPSKKVGKEGGGRRMEAKE